MTGLRPDFLQASLSDMPHEEKINSFIKILNNIDPENEDDCHTLWNMLNKIGVFEKEAIELGLYTMERNYYSPEEYPDHQGPRYSARFPVMTAEQARITIELLKERLPVTQNLWVNGFDTMFVDKAPSP